jgi:hypothetical protein
MYIGTQTQAFVMTVMKISVHLQLFCVQAARKTSAAQQ